MKTIVTPEFTRPRLEIEETWDDETRAERDCWAAVQFTAPTLPPSEVIGKYDKLQLQWSENFCETWEFDDVRIMLFPTMPPSYEDNQYILTYNKVQRITGVKKCDSITSPIESEIEKEPHNSSLMRSVTNWLRNLI